MEKGNNSNKMHDAKMRINERREPVKDYFSMQAEIDRLKREKEELLKQMEDADYRALQLQIRPHFLYNALNSINCLARLYGKDDISEMINGLGHVLRYSTCTNQDKVTLKDEITHVREYCMLQALLYQDRFNVEYRIDEKYYGVKAVRFMLQPLVENALKHGVEDGNKGLGIVLGVEETDDLYNVFVWNSGKSFSKEVYKDYQNYFGSNGMDFSLNDNKSRRIGLVNIHKRLRMNFGVKSGIRIDLSAGSKVIILIPKGEV